MKLQKNTTLKNLIHTAVVTLFAASAAQAEQAVQWRVADGGNGHWYALNAHGGMTWSQLNQLTLANGGHLATMTGAAERDFLVTLMAGNSCAIGGFQTVAGAQDEPAIGWGWCTGEATTWTNWAGGEPNNTDLYGAPSEDVMGCRSDGRWVDLADHLIWTQYYLSEWDADCDNNGVVDYGQCRDGTLPDYNCNNIPDCCERSETCAAGNYPVQWRTEDGGNGHWYRMVTTGTIGWHQARSVAVEVGGDLASITTLEESEFVLVVTSNPSGWVSDGPYLIGPWLGGYQDHSAPDYHEPAGGWRWVSGETWQFTRWLSPEPNNGWGGGEDFLNLLTQPPVRGISPYWNDSPANSTNNTITSLVVEWSADCNGDGIVDYGQILQGQLGDTNTDGVPDICQQPTCRDADLFRDLNVNGADLGILLSQWGPNAQFTVSDINKDGSVNGADLGLLLSFWGACP